MKLAGISGKGRGRLGSMVFSASAGEQVVRQYQPNVSNPNTKAQVAQRAKFKLMAQIAAAVSGEIIIPRDGLKSPRNQFQKKNFGLLSTDGDTATLQYEGLQFTAGNVAIPAVAATRAVGGINVALAAAANVSRVVYLAYRKSAQGALQFASSTIVNAAGVANTFPTTLDAINGEAVIYAYGMRDLSASATAKYGNYSVDDGTALATLVLSRTLSTSDYQFTRTSGTTVPRSASLTKIIMGGLDGRSPEIIDAVTLWPEILVDSSYESVSAVFDDSVSAEAAASLTFNTGSAVGSINYTYTGTSGSVINFSGGTIGDSGSPATLLQDNWGSVLSVSVTVNGQTFTFTKP